MKSLEFITKAIAKDRLWSSRNGYNVSWPDKIIVFLVFGGMRKKKKMIRKPH